MFYVQSRKMMRVAHDEIIVPLLPESSIVYPAVIRVYTLVELYTLHLRIVSFISKYYIQIA